MILRVENHAGDHVKCEHKRDQPQKTSLDRNETVSFVPVIQYANPQFSAILLFWTDILLLFCIS